MRKLVGLVVVAGLIWSGLWVAASQAIERGLSSWLSDRAAEGWQAETSAIGVLGYPGTMAVRLEGLALADPDTGLAWIAPEFRFSAPAHAPTRVTAIWPGQQTIATPLERIEISSKTMEAGLGLDGGLSLTLDTSDMALRDIRLTSTRRWTAGLDAGTLTTRRLSDRPLAHDIRFAATGVTPSQAALRRFDPAGLLPDTITALELNGVAEFDAPWDKRAVEDRRPQITALDLEKLRAEWGTMVLEAAGDLTVDPDGIPTGRVDIRAVNWREMLEVLSGADLVPMSILPTIERGLEILAGLSGNPNTIDAALGFQNGFMSLGPVPLGPAPRLVIR